MKRLMLVFLPLLLALCPGVPSAYSQSKLAQTGFQFLSVGTDARATAMGEAFTTIEGSSASMFYNPAGMARLGGFIDLSANQMKWIADIKYFSGSAAVAPEGGRYGVIGLSVLKVNYGEFKFTRVAKNLLGYEDIADFAQPGAYLVGLGYARELSDKFSVGGQAKYVYQDLGDSYVPVYTKVTIDTGGVRTDTTIQKQSYNLSVLAFDFGTIYKTGLKSLAFGMTISNFSREITYARESFQLPLTFKVGVSMNLVDLMPSLADNHSLLLSVDAVHPRSYPEFVNVGAEYWFMNTVALRAGYISNHDDYDFVAGVGVKKFGLAVDYSFMPHKVFDNVHRFSVRFSM